uniref:Uncharacterized protein n=1 Tax=viral metagenome TaxID=1070528 RepID=A0A6M3KVT5_9ZZZZ
MSDFIINEELDKETLKPYFSITGKHVVVYQWDRMGRYRTREEAEKAVKGLITNLE